jgi:hypothetical protein
MLTPEQRACAAFAAPTLCGVCLSASVCWSMY